MYAIIRWIVFIALLLLCILILKKHNKLKKKTLIISIVVTLILIEISGLMPIENRFVYFQSAESAYKYINMCSIKYIIEGENSDLVVGNNKIDTDKLLIIPKNESGWQIGLGKDIDGAITVSDTCGLEIYNYKPTNEYYIFVTSAIKGKLRIKDNHNSEFKHINNPVMDRIKSYEYAAFVGNIDNNYRLTINNMTYKLSKSDKGDSIYEMQLVKE